MFTLVYIFSSLTLNKFLITVYYTLQKNYKIVKKKRIYSSFIINELKVQEILQGIDIEKIVHQNITPEEFNLTLAEPLGPSLKDLYKLCEFDFSVNTICNIGIRLVKIIQRIHQKKIVHSHLDPTKIMIGISEFSKFFISDFSRAHSYEYEVRKQLKSGANLKNRKELTKIGVFSGRNVIHGTTPTFLDDLDSLLYILLYFFNGNKFIKEEIPNYQSLPYEGRVKALETYKLLTSHDKLCKKAPKLFLEFCKYIRELREGEPIDYNGLIGSLKLILANLDPSKIKISLKGKFDWLNNDKFGDLILNYTYKSSSPSPTNRSPARILKAGQNFELNSLSPTVKNVEKYNQQIKLEKIAEVKEESEKIKPPKLFEKINQLNKNSEFVFKNAFQKQSVAHKVLVKENSLSEEEKKEEVAFEQGGSPNKRDFAMLHVKKEDFSFSNALGFD